MCLYTHLFVYHLDSIPFVYSDPNSLVPSHVELCMQDLVDCEPPWESEFSEPQTMPRSAVCASDSKEHGVTVQGRLCQHSQFWIEELEASEFVRGIILQGYRLPFSVFPPPLISRNHHSAFQHADFVSDAITDLGQSGCVVQTTVCPTVCSPLQVVVNAKGKRRLVLDLRYVNQYLCQSKFKYEGLNLVPSMFQKGDYVFTFDLKSGYHHVDIHVDSQTYLGFSWGEGVQRRFYVFRVLPFGLATACYVFTKLLRPLVKRWRSMGLRVILYIDDGICASISHSQCCQHRDVMLSDMESAGLVLSVPKCHLEPHQIADWLGYIIDLVSGCFRIPGDKIDRLHSAIQCISPAGRVAVRILSSIVGRLISMRLALGPIAHLRTRSLYAVIKERVSWSDRVFLSLEAQEELVFWQANIEAFNGQPIWFSPGTTRVAYSDASSSGYGGYVVEFGPEFAHGLWSPTELELSSTWRELKAVAMTLRSFADRLKGHAVKWFSDNQNVVRIVQRGSRKPHLQDGAMSIFELCFSAGIKLEMEWIPRDANELADYASRIREHDDWKLDPVLFVILDAAWGPHSIDCFASEHNTQLIRFHSHFWCPGTEAVDTFTVCWQGETCWLVPPLHLVCRAIQHARVCSAWGTLVIPLWKSAPFWPLLCPDGRHLAPFVQAYHIFPFYEGIILPGLSGNNIGDAMTDESCLLAVLFDFSVPERQFSTGYCLFDFTGKCDLCIPN